MKLRVGKVVSFKYLQPLYSDFPTSQVTGKVTSIRENLTGTSKDGRYTKIGSPYYRGRDPLFQRTDTLVTLEDTRGFYKSYYVERTENMANVVFGKMRFIVAHYFHNVFARRA